MNIIKKEASTERSYDMRAQPRRRPKEENEQPLFLKKAFSMIDTCPSHLGADNASPSLGSTKNNADNGGAYIFHANRLFLNYPL